MAIPQYFTDSLLSSSGGLLNSIPKMAPPPLFAAMLSSSPKPRTDKPALKVYEQAALVFANEQRLKANVKLLVELPEGITVSECECALAKALPIVDGKAPTVNSISVRVGSESIAPPSLVVQFLQNFDAGRYPELELETL